MKKTLSLLLVLCMAFALLPTIALADDFGSCGENTFWTLDDNGTLTISGTGPTDSFYAFINNHEKNVAPWVDSMKEIRHVVIEEGVTGLGMLAFQAASNLETVSFPDSLVSIGDHAFGGCTSLREVTFPADCMEIGSFESCESLEKVVFPEALEVIPPDCFYHCGNLKSIDIPSTVHTLGISCFSDTAIKELRIPDGVETLPMSMCKNCSDLREVVFSDSVRTIENECFFGCSSLELITDSKNLQRVDSNAFRGCESLKSFRLPEEMISIPAGLFSGCCSLEYVNIPSGVTAIYDSAFFECRSLRVLELPSGLKTIGRSVFNGCTSIQTVSLPPQVETIGEGAFGRCTSMVWIAVPDSVTSIGNGAFKGAGIEAFRIPVQITTIPGELFFGCDKLELLTIPSSVTRIQGWAFSGCNALQRIQYRGTEEKLRQIIISPEGNSQLGNVQVYLNDAYPDPYFWMYDLPDMNHWSWNGIAYCLSRGFMNGVGNGFFDPDGTTTRAQLVTILWRMCGEPESAQALPFSDCGISWADAAIAWAAENGIVNGVGEGLFAPDAPITREQLVTIFHRFCKEYLEMDVSQTQALDSFPDADSVSDWAQDAMQWGVGVKLISGVATKDGAILQPQGSATRAQIAKVILNFFENVYTE